VFVYTILIGIAVILIGIAVFAVANASRENDAPSDLNSFPKQVLSVPKEDLSQPITASQCLPPEEEQQYFQNLENPNVALKLLAGRLLLETHDGHIVFPQSRTLHNYGIIISDIRGMAENEIGIINGDFRPGTPVTLIQNCDNPNDPQAVGVSSSGASTAGYIDIQNAKHLLPRFANYENLQAISLRGAGPGTSSQAPQILIADVTMVRYLLRDVWDNLYTKPKRIRFFARFRREKSKSLSTLSQF